jgi:hypothetical protein
MHSLLLRNWGPTMDPFGTAFVLSHNYHGYRICDVRSPTVGRAFYTGFHASWIFAWVSTAWRMWAGMSVRPDLVKAVSLDGGAPLWTTPWSSDLTCLGMDSVQNSILFLTENRVLVALDRRDGSVQATRPGIDTLWTLAGGTMHLIGRSGWHFISSSETGAEVRIVCKRGANSLGAVVCGDLVFISWFSGGITGYSLATGKAMVRSAENVWLTDIHYSADRDAIVGFGSQHRRGWGDVLLGIDPRSGQDRVLYSPSTPREVSTQGWVGNNGRDVVLESGYLMSLDSPELRALEWGDDGQPPE